MTGNSVIMSSDSPWMTARDVAERLRVHPSTVYRLKGLKRYRVGKRVVRFHREDVDSYVSESDTLTIR